MTGSHITEDHAQGLIMTGSHTTEDHAQDVCDDWQSHH